MNSIRNIVKRIRENRIINERADYESMDHKELVQLAQDGDQYAFEKLVDEYTPAIESVSSKFILDSGDRDDVRQIATTGFWEAVQKWDGKGSFGAFATVLMKRKLTDALRKDSAEKALINSQARSLDEPVAGDEGGESSFGDTLPSKSMSPEEEYLGRAGARDLVKFMRDNLSDSERQVIKLYIKGYKVSEISEEIGMKYKSVENAIMRVKNKMADYLRTRESKKIRESVDLEFSDEEKRVLNSVLSKLDNSEDQ